MFQSFFVAYFPACAVCSMQSFSNRLPDCESGKAPIPHTTSGNKPVIRLSIFTWLHNFPLQTTNGNKSKFGLITFKWKQRTFTTHWIQIEQCLGATRNKATITFPEVAKHLWHVSSPKLNVFFPDSVYLFVCLFVCWLVKCVLLLPHNVFATAVSTKPVNNRMHLQKHSACTVHKKLSTTDVSFPPKQPKSWPKSLVFFFSKRLTRWGKWLWRFGRSEGNWLYGGKWRQVEPAFHPCHAVRPQAHCTTLGGLWSGYAGAGEMTLQVLQSRNSRNLRIYYF